jgi:saccharopine dehydrogenase-like NADP-dependent oxidoreductase
MKNILLIGGSTGIGWSIVQKIATNNNVFVASRTHEKLNLNHVTHIPFDASTEM